MKIKVGVIFGGESVEHEVSIITAVQAMEFIDDEKYEVIPIYISKDRTWYTGHVLKSMDIYKETDNLKHYTKQVTLVKKQGHFYLLSTKGIFKRVVQELDLAFPIVHGKGVEDGSLAGYLTQIGIPFVGPKVLGAALGQDKVVQKQVLEASGLPVVDYTWFYDYEYVRQTDTIIEEIEKLIYPVIVKPALLGSSIGIGIAKNKQELIKAIEEAITYDTKIIVEQMIEHPREIDCAVLGNYERMETSQIGEMFTKNELLTFNDKYIGGSKGKMKAPKMDDHIATNEFQIPAILDSKVADEIYDLSKKAFRALNLSGVTRFDFLMDPKTNKIYINEPNTIPGCLAFFFFKPKEYTQLLEEMITIAIKEYKNERRKVTSFDSNILTTYQGGGKGAKGKIGNPKS